MYVCIRGVWVQCVGVDEEGDEEEWLQCVYSVGTVCVQCVLYRRDVQVRCTVSTDNCARHSLLFPPVLTLLVRSRETAVLYTNIGLYVSPSSF